MTVDRSTISASGGQADAVRWAATLPTGAWRSNMAAILLRTTLFSQRVKPSPLWWGTQVDETSFEFGLDAQRRKSPAYGGTDHGALARLTASWQQTRESGGGNGERGLGNVPPPPETRSDRARVPTGTWKPAAPTTSHSPGRGLTRNDEPARRVLVTLPKRSFNLLMFTGLPPTGGEAGGHVSIKDLADPDTKLARSLRRG